ncbi:MAG TPA: GNAT family N-acetyltransferase [bacterium]|nr:GNAT family N-acetyltransferase [bacterium]HOL49337.1 GNAT family N-acetyltransferase [bacterium]HPO51464.1 GNAT family N-acetyltransferase [bacterium]
MLRQATEKDRDAIMRIVKEAFNYNAEKMKTVQQMNLSNWHVYQYDNQIIGCLRIARDILRIGKAKIVKGEVGYVSILPEYQGKNHGTLMMQSAVSWMNGNDFDISRLGGRVRFYSRFGYIRFPRRYIEIFVSPDTGIITNQTHHEQLPGQIQIFNAEKDKKELETFISTHNLETTGQPEYFGKYDEGKILLYRENNKIRGVIGYRTSDKEHSNFEAKIEIDMLVYDRDCQEAFKHLVTYIHNEAFRSNINRITCRIPFSPEIVETLSNTEIFFNLVETYGGRSSNMLQVINFNSLVEKLIPEFQHRLQMAGIETEKTIKLTVSNKGSIYLKIIGNKMKIVENHSYDIHFEFSQLHFLQLILGLISYQQLHYTYRQSQDTETYLLGTVLFPQTVVFSGCWG